MTTHTHCPYCALQCGIRLVPDAGKPEGRLAVEGWREFPTNRGDLCEKGWTAAELLDHPERLTTPLARDSRSDELRPVSWDDALDRVATAIERTQQQYGRDAVGMFGGGSLTNEKAYLMGKFARVGLRTPHIDYNGRFCMSSAAGAGIRAFGVDRGLPFPLADIARTEVILLVGANPAEVLPPSMRYFDQQSHRAGSELIVVDPRRTPTAERATLHLQNAPGTDLAIAAGLLHLLIRNKCVDRDYLAARTTGFAAVERSVAAFWPDRVEQLTGVGVEQLERAAALLGGASTAMVLTARGAEQHSKGTDTTTAFINLALALGLVGKPYSGFGTLTGQGNGQGGREHGQKADQLPGYRKLADPAHRAAVAAVWGIDPDELPGPGRPAFGLLDSLGAEGGIRTLLLLGSNVVVSAPDAGRIRRRMAALDFLVVADFFRSESAEFADVVLPAAQWAEEAGTTTNLEGRVLLRDKACDPPDGVRTDLEILVALAERLGRGRYFPSSVPAEVFAELRRASAGGIADYAGISYERIAAEKGVFWPCPSEDHPGTPRLFAESFPTEDGRARCIPVNHRRAGEEPPDADYPLYLTTGRVRSHYQSGTQTRRVKRLQGAVPAAYVEIHPGQADALGIADADEVRVSTRRGTATVRAKLTPTIRPDVLFMPFHWGGDACANLLTNPELDPVSQMPEFKCCAARIEAVRTS